MRHAALLAAAALIGFGAASAQAQPDYYLYVAGGATTDGDMAETPEGVDNDLDGRDNLALGSVLVADVDTDAKTVTNWRRAGNLLPDEHPDTGQYLHWGYLFNSVNYYNGRLYVGPATRFSASDHDTVSPTMIAWADVNPDGSLGEFQLSDPFPEPPSTQRIGGTAFLEVNGSAYVYILGGAQDEPGYTDRILYAPIDATTGEIGPWDTAGMTIPTTDWFNPAIGIDGTLVHFSGNQPDVPADDRSMRVDLITPEANGDLTGAWVSETYSTDYSRRWEQAVMTATDPVGDTFLYLIAGSGAPRDLVYYTKFEFGLTSVWENGTPLPEERGRPAGAAANDMIVMPGGSSTTGASAGVTTVFIGTVAEGGQVTWEESPEPMMQARSYAGAAMAPVEDAVSVPEWMLY